MTRVKCFRIVIVSLVILSSGISESVATSKMDNYVEPTFYLNAAPGCYEVTASKTYTVAAVGYKRLFKTDCYGKHHIEVFYKGKISNSRVHSWNFCQERSKMLKFAGRSSSMYNWSNDEFLIVSNYFPDPGPETARFPNVVICYAAVTVEGARLLKEINRPIVIGAL